MCIRDRYQRRVRGGMKVGWNGVDNGWIRFHHVRIPRENLLNRFANVAPNGEYTSQFSSKGQLFAATLSQLMVGRLLYFIGPSAAIHACLKAGLYFAFQRTQFGDSKHNARETQLIQYPTHFVELMKGLAFVYVFESAGNEMCQRLFDAFKDEQKREEFHALMSGLKAYICEYTPRFASKIRVMCGGYGYSAYARIGEMRRDLDIFQTAEGDGTVLHQQLARYLIINYQKELSSYSGKFQLVQEKMNDFLYKSNPLNVRSTAVSYICSRAFFLKCFHFQVRYLKHSITMKLRALRFAKLPPMTAWSNCLLEIVELSKAASRLFALEQFHARIAKCTDAKLNQALELISVVYSLSVIDEEIGFFRNTDFIGSQQALRVRELFVEKCRELTELSIVLVNASEPYLPQQILKSFLTDDKTNYMLGFFNIVKNVKL
eukprot:TRINITY_DN727_c0_g3_i7.p1 TRINITY_DN727_c0_g3~~TRINITY_DN727_c0_g3_i7.p1  ORF type:complete len:432 (-),score=83.50 TRINITY_DN727_c0_g3_i7:45-1340(-)